jgi:hypothetical protein
MIPFFLGSITMSSRTQRSCRDRTRLRGPLAVSWLVLLILSGASDPEIVRVQVPAKEVSKWFPAGTELRFIPSEKFDSLVEGANRGSSRQRALEPPRLIRARHRARWGSGVLSGSTELVIEAASTRPAEFVLDPWTPAILPTAKTAKVLGARDSGQPSVWIDQGPNQNIVLEWELRPRSHARGRSFTLGLPGDDTTVLALEVPKHWVPSSRRGRRRGPLPAALPEQNLWEIEAEAGRIELHLYDPGEGESLLGSGAWLSGATQIDLRRTTSRTRGMVNWTTDWWVELDPRNPERLEIELDPGLELIKVQGPAVQGYRIEPRAAATRVDVTLGGDLKSPTQLQFLAHARVPSEGPWRIPAMRPRNATWTGGNTTVILDEFHVLQECREEAGRRLFIPVGDSGPDNRLVFESESPRSVAQLVFRKPRAESSCVVRGQLFVAGSPCRLESQLDWTFHHGTMSELEIDLSPTWIPDQVVIRGLNDPVAWHSSVLPSGSTRLFVALPASRLVQTELVLLVGASSTVPGGRGPLDLPRVVPVGTRILDEAWLAWVDQGTMIQPALARGLVWIDPGLVPGLLSPRGAGKDLREALAWRWIADGALARIDRERIEQEPSASIRVHAEVDPTARHLILDGRLVVSAGAASLESVPVWIDQNSESIKSWQFHDEADGARLPLLPIDETARGGLGFPREGSALRLLVKVAGQSEKTIHFHAEYPWNSHGSIPLFAVSRKYLFRGMVLVETPDGMRSRVKATRLRRLDPFALDQLEAEPEDDMTGGSRDDRFPAKHVNNHVFAYKDSNSRLELFTEPRAPSNTVGIIREALLTTLVDQKGTSLNRLRLLVHLGEARALDLVLPPHLSLVRVGRDGSDVAPIVRQSGLSISLPGSSQGPGSSTIVVDYIAGNRMLADGARLRPDLPQVAFPCLSFVWELVVPPGWEAGDAGSGWIANDGENRRDWPDASLGLWKPSWNFLRGPRREADAELFRALDDKLVDSASDELTFAEWFSRWDSGPRPILIDRVSLNFAGFGPKSLCVPSRKKAERRNVSLATLQQHGLAIVPFQNALLVTTAADRPKFEQPDRWEDVLGETLLWGSDRSDRFQTLPRWRGEPSPKVASTVGDEAGERIKVLEGWSTWRFSAANWPASNGFVHVIDLRARIATGWIITGTCLLAWYVCRGRLVRRRFLLLTSLLAGSLLVEELLPCRYASDAAAVFFAALVILLLELGYEIRRLLAAGGPAWRSERTLFRRAASTAVTAVLLGLVLGRLADGQPPAQRDRGSAILALFPYEGPFDPSRPAKDVILRLTDFSRLAGLAEKDVTPPFTSVRSLSALHRVKRKSAGSIVVESEFELIASGKGPFAWRIPVSFAREIEASLDGERLPILIEPGGMMGALTFSRAGSHFLRIRRASAARHDAGFETLSLPVNAMPSARVILEPQEAGMKQGETNAHGSMKLEADGSSVGRLGPADRIDVRWLKLDSSVAGRASGTVEGSILWDINPAGDRVRARLTFHQAQELSTIRLAHEPGLILRSARVSGSVASVWEENAGNEEWTLHVDSPLESGGTIELDCWMPLDARRGESGKSPAFPLDAATSLRRLPRLGPIGVDRYSGSLGVRRPGDWTGRCDPIPGTDLISDESFVKSWGNLPEEALTLCGTSRFLRDCRATLATGPTPPRLLVKPTVVIQLESGRIAMTVDAELSELSGHIRQLEAQLPENMRITQVTAEGLTDWTTSSDSRLHLKFERPVSGSRRHLRVSGWLPLVQDPLQIGSRQHRIRVPWIRWDGVEGHTGILTISSMSKPEMQGSTDLTMIPSESSGAGGTTPPRHRLTYRVDDSHRLGEIVWESVPARVSVSIESQMTIHPDSAEWVAVLRYDVVGGALEAIHVKMPAAWAGAAELQLAGSEYQLTTATRGPATIWSITPERPIWGSQRLVIRSSLPVVADREIVHPEIAPLGPGAVDAYVGVVDASGRAATIEKSAGLKPIPYSTKFQAREFAVLAGAPLGAFQVTLESWVLRVQLPRSASETGDSQGGTARVAFADLLMVAMPDRSSLGRAVYETVPGSGSLLSFELPISSSLLWATVDSNLAVPLRSTSGTYSLALDDRRPSRVGLIWQTGSVPPQSSGSTWPVALPRAGTGPATTLVTVTMPPEVTVHGDFGGLEPATMARLEMARADWLARSIGDLVAKIDRSSGRDHEKLVSMLISHEMALRSAERSEEQRDPAAAKAENDRTERHSELIRAARAARVETTRRAGLEQDLAAAAFYLGTSPANLTRPQLGVPEPNAPDRIRRFGRPFALIGVMPGLDEPSPRTSLILERRPWPEDANRQHDQAIIALALLLGIVLVTTAWRLGIWGHFLALVMALGLAGYTGGPLILAGGLGLAAAGWKRARG